LCLAALFTIWMRKSSAKDAMVAEVLPGKL